MGSLFLLFKNNFFLDYLTNSLELSRKLLAQHFLWLTSLCCAGNERERKCYLEKNTDIFIKNINNKKRD